MDIPATPTKQRKKGCVRFGVFFVLVLCLGVAGALLTLRSQWLKDRVGVRLEEQFQARTGWELQIGTIQGMMPWSISFDYAELRDKEGAWLIVHDVVASLETAKLLTGRVRFDFLNVGEIEVLRKVQTEEEASASFKIPQVPRIPPWLSLDAIELKHVHFAEEVFGKEMEFSAEASLLQMPQNGDWELELNVTGKGQTSTKAELKLGRHDDVPLVSLQLEDASVMPLLLEMKTPLRMNLDGEMLGEIWQGQMKGTAGDDVFSDMALTLHMDADPLLEAKGSFAINKIPKLLALQPFLGDSIGIDLTARLLDDMTVHIERFTPQFSAGLLHTAGLKLGGNAKLAINAATLQAKLNYEIEDAASIASLIGQDIQGKVFGDIQIGSNANDTTLALTINPESIATHGVLLTDTHLLCTLTSADGLRWPPFPITWELEGNGKATYAALALERNVTLSSSGQWTELNTLNIGSLLLDDTNTRIDGQGNFDFATMTGAMESTVTVADLDAWTNLFNFPLHGEAQAQLHLASAANGKGVDLKLESDFTNISGLYDPYLSVFGNSCKINLQAILDTDATQVQEFQANIGPLLLTGTGSYQNANKQISLDTVISSETLAPFATLLNREMEGQLNAHLTLDGTLDALELDSEVKVSKLNMPPFQGSEATLETHISSLPHAPQGDFQVTMNDAEYGFEGGGNFSLDDAQILLKDIVAKAGKNNLKAEAEISRDFTSGSVQLNANLPDLKPIGAILNQDLSGQAKVDADFTLEKDKAPLGTLKLTASDFGMGTLQRASFGMNMSATAKGLAVSSEGDGYLSETIPFTYKGSGNLELPKQRFSLNALSLNLDGHEGQLQDTASIQRDEKNNIILSPFTFNFSNGVLHGEGQYTQSALSLKARLENVALEDLDGLGLPALEGTLDAEATMNGTPAEPQIFAQLHLRNIKSQRAASKNMPLLGMDATLDYRDGVAQIKANGNAPEFIDLEANAELPLRVSLSPLSLQYPAAKALSGALHGTMKLDYLSYLIASEVQSLAGNLLLDVSLGGAWNNVALNGEASITDARYENGKTGTIIEDLDIKMDVDADKIIVTHCEAIDVNKGLLKGTGEIQLSLDDHFPYAFNFELKDSHLIHRDDYKVTINGPVKLRGNADSCLLEGDIVTRPVWVTLDMTSPAAKYKPVEYREVNGELQQDDEEEARARALPIQVNYDLRCDIPSQLYIQTSVLDTEWKGKIRIQGTLEEPSFSGNLQSIHGQLDFLGKRFLLKDSTVNMNPENVRAPYLNVVAMTESGDVEAGVSLQGPADAFDISLISNPALPEDEVLSQILFGRPLKDINPIQAIELARDAALLGGRFNGMGIFGISSNTPGLDALTIKTGDTLQDTQVGFGTFITDRFYLELLQGQVGTDASIEYRIAPGVKLKGATSFDDKSSIGLFWKKDY